MTRLTTDLIDDIPLSIEERDNDLVGKIGLTLKDLSLKALGRNERDLDLSHFRVAAVPISSGKGVIPSFSNSVCAITRHMGMDSFVTTRPDVTGVKEAMTSGADIIYMADDEEFIALNLRSGKSADNVRSTALGYCTALEAALCGVSGSDVLVVGAGKVGSCAIERLVNRGASVTLLEVDPVRAAWAKRRFGVSLVSDPKAEMRRAKAILNASPAKIPGSWIGEGTVISSPGVPYGFDAEGERKARVIIHDPLQIGVAVMAAWSASLSQPAAHDAQLVRVPAEALE